MPKIERAILSCYDKDGLVEFAKGLREFDIELISTEGTHAALSDAGVETCGIGDFTGVREMMNGRVKSLHPKVHAGLLGIRDNKLHVEEMQTYQCQWIDLVVVNPHPIDALLTDSALTPEEIIEQVDIGGVAMVRSAAKNHRYVGVVVNPERYPSVLHDLRAHEGSLPFKTRFRLAQEAFACTAQYDKTLAEYLQSCEPPEE